MWRGASSPRPPVTVRIWIRVRVRFGARASDGLGSWAYIRGSMVQFRLSEGHTLAFAYIPQPTLIVNVSLGLSLIPQPTKPEPGP